MEVTCSEQYLIDCSLLTLTMQNKLDDGTEDEGDPVLQPTLISELPTHSKHAECVVTAKLSWIEKKLCFWFIWALLDSKELYLEIQGLKSVCFVRIANSHAQEWQKTLVPTVSQLWSKHNQTQKSSFAASWQGVTKEPQNRVLCWWHREGREPDTDTPRAASWVCGIVLLPHEDTSCGRTGKAPTTESARLLFSAGSAYS